MWLNPFNNQIISFYVDNNVFIDAKIILKDAGV